MLSACFPHHSRVVASFCALALSLAAVGTFQCASVPRGGVVSGVDSANSGGDQLLETAPEDNESPAECISYPDLAQPQWFHKAVMYEIFVRSFQDSDGDGIGDLQGIIQRLDYLNDGDPKTETDLGITLLWLMPISPSPSYHGYDVTDYRSVNPDYGTAEDLKTLVEEADKRGIKILLDLVMNHSSDQHPWFVDSAQSTSTRRDWYLWAETAHNWPRPWGDKHSTWHKSGDQWYYGIFWSGMPDLNYTVPAVRTEMTDVARFWMQEYGIAGYRLDAVRYLVETGPEGLQDSPETMAFWKEFSTTLRSEFPEILLLGEAWASNAIAAQYQVDGSGLQLTFDFDLMESLVVGLLAEEPADIENVLCRFASEFPPGSGDAIFLTNHDLIRLASRLKERPELTRLAAQLLFVLPGMPMLYYGQEIGMTNGPTLDDRHKRKPMQWDSSKDAGFTTGKPWESVNSNAETVNVAEQMDSPDSLLSLYRALIRLRTDNVSLSLGGFYPLEASSKTAYDVWGFVRSHSQQKIVVYVNYGEAQALDARVTLPDGEYTQASVVFPEPGSASIQDGEVHVGDVPGYSLFVVTLK